MRCPLCHAAPRGRAVISTRSLGAEVERLRRCDACGHTWRTYESIAPRPVPTRKRTAPAT